MPEVSDTLGTAAMGAWQMDLRKLKTEEALRDAFLHLRASQPLERITVRELCDRARVGKATFYLHYHDVYDLSEHLQADLVQQVLASIPHPQLILTDTPAFTREFGTAIWAKKSLIDILFEGSQASVLPAAIERALLGELQVLSPGLTLGEQAKVALTYQIYGAYYAYVRWSAAIPADKLIELVGGLTEGLGPVEGQ